MKTFRMLVLLILSFFMSGSLVHADVNVKPKIAPTEAIQQFSEKRDIKANELVVKFKASISAYEKGKILNSFKTAELSYIDKGSISLIRASKGANVEGLASKLVKLPQIEFVEPNYYVESTYTPKEPSYGKQWYLKKISMPAAWDITKGSSQITVAVIDGGVQKNHPELASKIISPYNAATGGTSYASDNHGTHVAGIIAASINKKGIAGIAPNVKLMPINVFSGELTDTYTVVKGIYYAADHGANVINMSLGSPYYSYSLDSAIQYAASKGIVMVAAAGNEDTYQEMYPAALDSVLAVSATDKRDYITNFSNYGYHIDFAAPGQSIYSTVKNSKYTYMSGTSMAAPVVSGTAALVLSKNPLLTAKQVESILKKSVSDLGRRGWDYYYGYGRIDAYKALKNTPAPMSAISTNVNTFNMKGTNKVTASFTAYKNSLVTVQIQNSQGQTIKSLIKNKKSTGSKMSAAWDGKSDKGSYAGSGTYKIVVKASNGKETVTRTKSLKVNDQIIPSIGLSAAAVSFSPKVKGKVSIPFTLNKNAKVTAKIYANGKAIKTLWNKKSLGGGKHTLYWDGKDAKGRLSKDGTYQLSMSVEDYSKRKGTTRKKTIKIDTTAPSASITLNSSTFKMDGSAKTSVKIKFAEKVKVSGYVMNSKGIKLKKLISNKNYNKGTYTVTWDGKNDKKALVTEGTYYFAFEAADSLGNKRTVKSKALKVQDWRKPSFKGETSLIYKEKGPLDISFTISKPGKVTVEIPYGSEKILLTQSFTTPGQKTVTWDGKINENEYMADGSYEITVTFADKYGQTATFTSNLTVLLTETVIDHPAVVQAEQEVFYSISQPGKVTVEIFNNAGDKVRTVYMAEQKNAGTHSFSWDGKNDDGNDVSEEPYTFVITAENAVGSKTAVSGKINDNENPEWLASQLVSFIPEDEYSNNGLRLTITVSKAVKTALYVSENGEWTEKENYELNIGENIFAYEKLTLEDQYYRLVYKDHLGNEYSYEIDESYYDHNTGNEYLISERL